MPSSGSNTGNVLVLYTELAPYILSCLGAFADRTGSHVHLVRWPVNAEAPFELRTHPGITIHERKDLDDAALLALAERLAPRMVLASGWVDKGYLKVCRKVRGKGVPTVMGFDTAWRGGAKQMASSALGRLWVPGTFSHAWATGAKQARYAENLGFPAGRIRTGFYAADTDPFLAEYPMAMAARKQQYPHRFICVARYIPIKGHQLLCDAFVELCNAGKATDWELHLVGVGESLETVRHSASGQHPRVKHRGFVQASDMPQVLRDSGVSVLPSTYEPWGVVVQEHACMGLPLLLSDAVGARERFLVEGENGHIHTAGDQQALQQNLLAFIERSDEELFTMGQRSHELGAAWTPADWAKVAADIMAE